MNNEFKKGLKNGLPICIGYLAVSFSFGIFAVANGLTVLEAILISLTNLTSAGQLAAVPIIACGGSLFELALSQVFINLRYALMSVSLSQKFDKDVKLYDRFFISFANTDEVFGVASTQKGSVSKSFMYGLILTPILGWTIGTAFGAFSGGILPTIVVSALGIAIYGMFIAIVIPAVKAHKPTAVCVLVATALGLFFYYVPPFSQIPSGFTIIICAVLSSLLLALIAPIEQKENE
ncbi:MAG: AzlC family ABC transporter permease [Clostridia bacterium]|nr:AzlC family ABC transporter permease [Clostridia bacterium]